MFSLKKCILATLIYYDAIDVALSSFEIYKYIINPFDRSSAFPDVSFMDVLNSLEGLQKSGEIEERDGLYFLAGRADLVDARIHKQKLSDKKWKIFLKDINLISWMPFLKLVMASGSMVLNNANPNSDFDVLVVAEDGHIWTVRLLLLLCLQLFGKRRYGPFTKDRICLNHFIVDTSMSIPYHSLYTASSYIHLIPILDKDDLFPVFIKENSWIDKFAPHGLKYLGKNQKMRSQAGHEAKRRNASSLSKTVEKFAKILQEEKIKKNPFSFEKGGRIVVNDKELEFHPLSEEKRILNYYNNKVKELGIEGIANESDSGLR